MLIILVSLCTIPSAQIGKSTDYAKQGGKVSIHLLLSTDQHEYAEGKLQQKYISFDEWKCNKSIPEAIAISARLLAH